MGETDARRTAWEPYIDADLGFRNHWYPALFGAELAEADVSDASGSPVAQVRAEVLLGERILFRRVAGKVLAVQDQCLHKGVPFSKRPECYSKDTITCWYHGFTYDLASGTLTNIITDPSSTLIGRVALKTYPVEERQGLVFVFIGDIEPPPLEEDVPPGFLDESLYVHPQGWAREVACNWRLGAENGFDPAHAYLHRNSPLVRGFKVPTVLGDARISADKGMEVVNARREQPGPAGVRLLRGAGEPVWDVEVTPGVTLSARYKPDEPGVLEGMIPEVGIWMPGALRVDPFPAPHIVHFEWYVPVSERSHRYLIAWATKAPDEPARKRFDDEVTYLWREFVTEKFNNEDMFARQAMDEFYSLEDGFRRENLFGPDVLITAWRSLCARTNRGLQRRPAGAQSPARSSNGA